MRNFCSYYYVANTWWAFKSFENGFVTMMLLVEFTQFLWDNSVNLDFREILRTLKLIVMCSCYLISCFLVYSYSTEVLFQLHVMYYFRRWTKVTDQW